MKKILVVLIIMLFIGTSFIPSISSTKDKIDINKTIINKNDGNRYSTLEYKINFEMPFLKTNKVNGDTFTTINMPGSFSIGKEEGAPVFLVTPIKLLLPQETEVDNIVVTMETFEVTNNKGIDLKKLPIVPYQEPVTIDKKNQVEFVMNYNAYQSNVNVPDKTYESLGIDYCRGYTILTLNLYPTIYIPAKGLLFYHPEMIINVTLKENDENVDSFYRDNQVDKNWVESIVVNPGMTNTYKSLDSKIYEGGICESSEHFDYVIITRESLLDFSGTNYTWDDLIQRKQLQGLEATKISVEEILSCSDYWNLNPPIPEFNDTAYLIREFCRDAYQDWGLQYILVAGDQDGPSAIERRLMDGFESNIESDLYWSNLDKTFNDDFDNDWGERDDTGFDLYSELFIGSIPCDEPQDISNWLTKSFYYADNYDPDYLDNAAFYAGNSGWVSESDDLIEFSAIKGNDDWLGLDPDLDGTYPDWLGYLYGFETWNKNNPGFEFNLSMKWTGEDPNEGWYGGTTDLARNGFKNAINNNQVTLISGVAHAGPYESLDVISTKWESEYFNTKPFFLFDYGCHNGDMSGADDGVLHSMLFHSNTSLAFGCIMNTGYGFGSLWNTNSSSALQQKLFWDYMFNLNKCDGQKNWQLGKAMAWSKDVMANTIKWTDFNTPNSWRSNIEGCLLFGDPAQNLKPPIRKENNIGIHSLNISSHHLLSPESIVINATIINNGINNVSDVVISLLVDDTIVNITTIPFLQKYTTQSVIFGWIPLSVGVYNITVNITINGVSEEYYDDNEKKEIIIIGVQNINTSECFSTIQSSINDSNTSDDHSIIVPHGTYYENVVINKSVSLIGINKYFTIINGGKRGNVISITANNVQVTGFTIKNGTNGAYVKSSENVTIKQNEVCNNILGIFVSDFSNNISILYNDINNNTLKKLPANNKFIQMNHFYSGGITLKNISNAKVMCNNIYNNYYGIRIIDDSTNNIIYHNNFNNTRNAFDMGYNNQWDNGYNDDFRICGGNWWSNYNGTDLDNDGIGDIPYIIVGNDQDSQDLYPLIESYNGPLPGTIFVYIGNTEGPWKGTEEHPYQYIQDAINTSINNDTIFVHSGIYYENIVIDKSIHLTSENKDTTIIDGGFYGTVIYVVADKISITGFTIQNSGVISNYYGVDIRSDKNIIKDNNFINNVNAINIYCSNNNIISKNIISTLSYKKKGIIVYSSSYNNISNNTIKGNMIEGISIVSSFENYIFENTINCDDGIFCSISYNNIIKRNSINSMVIFSGNNNLINKNILTNGNVINGILIDQSHMNVISNNSFNSSGIHINANYMNEWYHTIENNTLNNTPIRYYKDINNFVIPQNTAQVILMNCSNIVIKNLTISDVFSGIQLAYSSNVSISKNTITVGEGFYKYGIFINDFSDNNKIYENTFFGNGIILNGKYFDIYKGINNNTIYSNNISNGFYGINLLYCHDNTIFDNSVNDFYIGICTLSSRNNLIFNNLILNNNNGIFMMGESSKNIIFDNEISNNRNGIDIYGDIAVSSDDNTIKNNLISNNTNYGIYIHSYIKIVRDNTIFHNNFINNTQQAYDEGDNRWYNETLQIGNYWDDFEDNDGFPYEYQIIGGNNIDIYPNRGDLDHDCDVDNDDLSIMISLQGYTISDDDYEPEADMDDNGVINSFDRLLLLRILNQ